MPVVLAHMHLSYGTVCTVAHMHLSYELLCVRPHACCMMLVLLGPVRQLMDLSMQPTPVC